MIVLRLLKLFNLVAFSFKGDIFAPLLLYQFGISKQEIARPVTLGIL